MAEEARENLAFSQSSSSVQAVTAETRPKSFTEKVTGLFSAEKWFGTCMMGVSFVQNILSVVSGVADGNPARIINPIVQTGVTGVSIASERNYKEPEGDNVAGKLLHAATHPSHNLPAFNMAWAVPMMALGTATSAYNALYNNRPEQLVSSAIGLVPFLLTFVDIFNLHGRRNEAKEPTIAQTAENTDAPVIFQESASQAQNISGGGILSTASRYLLTKETGFAFGLTTALLTISESVRNMGENRGAMMPLLVTGIISIATACGSFAFMKQLENQEKQKQEKEKQNGRSPE